MPRPTRKRPRTPRPTTTSTDLALVTELPDAVLDALHSPATSAFASLG